jgi:hypothetical protein
MIRKLTKNQRKQKRASISVPLKYAGDSETSDGRKIAGEGTTADLGENGLGFFSQRELEPGTVLEIECMDIWAAPKQFTVKWCDRIQYNFFRLGLEAKASTKA